MGILRRRPKVDAVTTSELPIKASARRFIERVAWRNSWHHGGFSQINRTHRRMNMARI